MSFGNLTHEDDGERSATVYHLDKEVSDASRGRYCEGISRLDSQIRGKPVNGASTEYTVVPSHCTVALISLVFPKLTTVH